MRAVLVVRICAFVSGFQTCRASTHPLKDSVGTSTTWWGVAWNGADKQTTWDEADKICKCNTWPSGAQTGAENAELIDPDTYPTDLIISSCKNLPLPKNLMLWGRDKTKVYSLDCGKVVLEDLNGGSKSLNGLLPPGPFAAVVCFKNMSANGQTTKGPEVEGPAKVASNMTVISSAKVKGQQTGPSDVNGISSSTGIVMSIFSASVVFISTFVA